MLLDSRTSRLRYARTEAIKVADLQALLGYLNLDNGYMYGITTMG